MRESSCDVTNVSAVRVEELVIVKVSFDSHHFPSETDPQAVGYSPPSWLNLCNVSSSDPFASVLNRPEVTHITSVRPLYIKCLVCKNKYIALIITCKNAGYCYK